MIRVFEVGVLDDIVSIMFQGYYRKAEVEFHTFRFSEALKSYGMALNLQPNNPSILDAINKASRSLIKDQKGTGDIHCCLFSSNP